MGERALRQYYGEDRLRVELDERLPSVEPAWRRHRARLLAALDTLDDEQWQAPSRCEGWTVQDVVAHLTTADGFWAYSLRSAIDGAPTAVLRGFDPAVSPEQIIDPLRALDATDVLDRFREATAAFVDAVDAVDDLTDGALVGESPVGNVQAHLVLAHALWDSWLHERDVLVPLGVDVAVEPDEVLAVLWYALAIGAAEGGLVGDPAPVGPGLDAPLDVVLGFDDLPGTAIRLRVDDGVRLELVDPAAAGADAVAAGDAVAFVEGFTGRAGDDWVPLTLPGPLAAHLRRAQGIL